MTYGASKDDWALFDLGLGLTEDLLPCVSNTTATVSPNSKLGDIGKVPSVYDRNGQVVGLSKWTERKSAGKDIEKWKRGSDYGICLQTREVRALDIDVPNREKAQRIVEYISASLGGMGLPTRRRNNSGKCLMAFRLRGNMPKRKIDVDGGIVEFLATGQQFVACGTHPSGARYEWEWNDLSDFPELTLEQFESLWTAIVSEFGIAQPVAGTLRKPKSAAGGGVGHGSDDPTAAFLISNNLVIGERDDMLYLTCPWKDGHSSDSGETETSYMVPNLSRGYQQGHFKCLHASCAARTDTEFKDALGCGVLGDFESLPDLEGVGGTPTPGSVRGGGDVSSTKLPAFPRAKSGEIEATVGNVIIACSHPQICGQHIAYDTFTDNILVSPLNDPEAWRPLRDSDYIYMRERLESGKNGFDPIGREMIRDAVLAVAERKQFDTAQLWLSKQQWDGTPRVASFLHRYLGVADTDYSQAVSRYIWTALAGRVIEPGIKADMVPIIVGAQGIMKSSAVAAMAPHADFATRVKLDDKDDNLARMMRGKLVIELPELSGLHTRELESIKAWVDMTHENWVPKYRETATRYARRCIFIGTTNMMEFLSDTTGNRRWLPVIATLVDILALIRDRDQLWAEAAAMFDLFGVDWSAEKIAGEVHEQHMMSDVWAETIEVWLRTNDDDMRDDIKGPRTFVTLGQVMNGALSIQTQNMKGYEAKRVVAILRKLGWEQAVRRVEGVFKKGWAQK